MKTKEHNLENKYYIMQNGVLTEYTNKLLAETVYCLNKQSSLIEKISNNTTLLFNRAYTAGLTVCDDLNSAIYLASTLGGKHESK